MRFGLVILFLWATVAHAEGQSSLETLEQSLIGKQVRSVSFLHALNLNAKELGRDLALAKGSTLRAGDLVASVAALERRGIFSHIDLRSRLEPEGVALEFLLTPRLRVAEILVVGNETLSQREILRLAGIRESTYFHAESLGIARERIRKGYADEGHFAAKIAITITERSFAPQVVLNIDIDEGKRTTLKQIDLVGELPEDLQFLKEAFPKNHKGLPASVAILSRLRKNLLTRFRNEGYLQASVDKPELQYVDGEGNAIVVLAFRTGSPVSIVFKGNTRFSFEELLAPLKIDSRTVPFTPNAIKTLANRIEGLYQENGYFFASATASSLGKEQKRSHYEIAITEGPLVRLSDVKLSGNKALDDKALFAVISSKPQGLLLFRYWRPGYVRADGIQADVDALRQLYEEKGFTSAQVRFSIQHDLDEDEIVLTFHIVEGELQTISEIEFEWQGLRGVGLDENGVPNKESLELLAMRSALHPGEPLMASAVEAERKRLRVYLRSLGYYNAKVIAMENTDTNVVRMLIEPGVRVRFGQVFLNGNIFTHDEVIRRSLKIAEGDPWRQDSIHKSEQGLFQLGSFRSVRIVPFDGIIDSEREDVVVEVRERDTGSLTTGIGYDTEDGIHVEGEIGQRNLYGWGHALVFGVDAYFKSGDRIVDAGNVRLGYRIPNIGGSSVTLYNELFGRFSLEVLDQFSNDRVGGSSSLSFLLDEGITASISVNAFNEDVFDAEPDVIIGPDDEGDTFYAFLRTELDLDKRDDPYNPRSGWRTVLRGGVSSEVYGSNVNLVDLFAQQSLFFPLTSRLVFANNARAQWIVPFGDTDVIPLSHRIFLGGRTTLRGFPLGKVGPKGSLGTVVGGDASFIVNSELQFDATSDLITVLFLDAGQTFLEEPGSFSGDTLNINDMRFTPGLGLRYRTPVGPISVDYGLVLDRESGESAGRFNVGVGATF